MDTAEFDVNDFSNRYAGDKSVYAKFYLVPVKNERKSAEAGRPIFEDQEYVEIRAAGNQNNIVRRPVSDMDRQRFAAAYELFKAGHDEQIIGTRLTEVPWLTRAQCEELAYMKIFTLEHLANVGDNLCIGVPGMLDLKRRAQAALEKAEAAAPFTAMQKENEDLRNKIDSLTNAVEEQAGIIKKLEAALKQK